MKKILGIISTFFGAFFLLFALIFGLVFCGLGFGFDKVNDAKPDYSSDIYASCVGTIISMEGQSGVSTGYDSQTVFSYTVDGIEYQGTVNAYNSSFSVGDTITVYYEVENPTRSDIPELTDEVFGFIGTVFSGFGIGFLVIFGIIAVALLVTGVVLIRSGMKDDKQM